MLRRRVRFTAKQAFTCVAAGLLWFALILQFCLLVNRARLDAVPLGTAVINYFSYYTILTNLLLAVSLTVVLVMPSSRAARWFSASSFITACTLYILVVGIVYSLALRRLWNPQGLQKVADLLLHDVSPLLYGFYWLLSSSKRGLRWRDPLLWLGYPFAYVVYTLTRGALSGRYPYPFIDVTSIGYPAAFINTFLLLCGFLGLGLVLVAIGRHFRIEPR